VAEIKDRPTEIRTVEVRIRNDREVHAGADLDDVLRQIVWDLKVAHEWEFTAEAARQLGLKQQTLSLFLDETLPGTSLQTLSRICAALRTTPVDLFRKHERYGSLEGREVRFAEDIVFDRFRALLTVEQARRLVTLLERLGSKHALAPVLDAADALLGARSEAESVTAEATPRRSSRSRRTRKPVD